jgi:hypothetical protein
MRRADRLSAIAFGGLALVVSALPAGAQQMACDGASNADPATCGAWSCDAATGSRGTKTQEQLGAHADALDRAKAQFQEADSDASGTISPEEWRNWRRQRSTETTQGVRGPLPTPDEGTWAVQAGDLR